jgi:hypothetical protein
LGEEKNVSCPAGKWPTVPQAPSLITKLPFHSALNSTQLLVLQICFVGFSWQKVITSLYNINELIFMAWIFVCCVLSGSLCDGLITRPEVSYRLWRVVVCDHEISWMRRP